MNRLLPLALLLLLTSCGSYEESCSNEAVNFRLIGFSKAEVDTIIIKQVSPVSGEPKGDSIVFLSEDYAQNNPAFSYDTLMMPYGALADSTDIVISIPGAAIDHIISGIEREPQHSDTYKRPFLSVCSGKPDGCYNKLLKYAVDGVEQSAPQSHGFVTIDIHR